MKSEPLSQVIFVVRKRFLASGSTNMRGPQLMAQLAPHLADRLHLRLAYLPGRRLPGRQQLWARLQPAGAVFLLTKGCLSALAPDTADILRRRGGRLLFDHVDRDMRVALPVAPDVHLASSLAQQRTLRDMQAAGQIDKAPVALLLHNADSRLAGVRITGGDVMRAAYLGDPAQVRLPVALAHRIEVLPAANVKAFAVVLDNLRAVNLHWAVRRRAQVSDNAIVKPFTKGITAAVCGANVLTSRSEPDAVDLLGDDYPYLCATDGDSDICSTFDRARDDFGGPDWQRGLAAMQALAQRVAPERLAADLCDIVRTVRG